jgi:hypothetical protein
MHAFQSVLQQQASRNLKCECNFSSPQANYGTVGQSREISNGSSNGSEVENLDSHKKSSTSIASSVPVKSNLLQQNIIKKQGVSGESCDVNIIGCSSDILIRKFEKDFK